MSQIKTLVLKEDQNIIKSMPDLVVTESVKNKINIARENSIRRGIRSQLNKKELYEWTPVKLR